jgi:hypothetical protein
MSRGAKLLIGGLVAAAVLAGTAAAVGVVVVRRALWWQPTAEQCLGFPLPAGSRVVADTGSISHAGERFFVIEMSRSMFDQLIAAGQFTRHAAEPEHWPGCLDAPPGFPWAANRVNDEDTVYRQANDALDIARWESGRLYYRHHVP